MKNVLMALGIVMIVAGFAWEIVIYVQTWDIAMSAKLKFLYYWKPVLLMGIGYIVSKIGQR
jgi:hypothetical protein